MPIGERYPCLCFVFPEISFVGCDQGKNQRNPVLHAINYTQTPLPHHISFLAKSFKPESGFFATLGWPVNTTTCQDKISAIHAADSCFSFLTTSKNLRKRISVSSQNYFWKERKICCCFVLCFSSQRRRSVLSVVFFFFWVYCSYLISIQLTPQLACHETNWYQLNAFLDSWKPCLV